LRKFIKGEIAYIEIDVDGCIAFLPLRIVSVIEDPENTRYKVIGKYDIKAFIWNNKKKLYNLEEIKEMEFDF
jgi:hypothetical protein